MKTIALESVRIPAAAKPKQVARFAIYGSKFHRCPSEKQNRQQYGGGARPDMFTSIDYRKQVKQRCLGTWFHNLHIVGIYHNLKRYCRWCNFKPEFGDTYTGSCSDDYAMVDEECMRMPNRFPLVSFQKYGSKRSGTEPLFGQPPSAALSRWRRVYCRRWPFIPGPAQKKCCVYDVTEFLKRECERIAAIPTVHARKHSRACHKHC